MGFLHDGLQLNSKLSSLCQFCRLSESISLFLGSWGSECSWSGGPIPCVWPLPWCGLSRGHGDPCAPASPAAPKNHGTWSKNVGAESSPAPRSGAQYCVCGSLLYFVLFCYMTILVIQSCPRYVLFKLSYSPFPETFVHIVFLSRGICKLIYSDQSYRKVPVFNKVWIWICF